MSKYNGDDLDSSSDVLIGALMAVLFMPFPVLSMSSLVFGSMGGHRHTAALIFEIADHYFNTPAWVVHIAQVKRNADELQSTMQMALYGVEPYQSTAITYLKKQRMCLDKNGELDEKDVKASIRELRRIRDSVTGR